MHFYSEFARQPLLPNLATANQSGPSAPAEAVDSSIYASNGVIEEEEGGGAMPASERAAWMQETVLQAVVAMLGREAGPEEPLMTAGLDSLGEPSPECMLASRGEFDHCVGKEGTHGVLILGHALLDFFTCMLACMSSHRR